MRIWVPAPVQDQAPVLASTWPRQALVQDLALLLEILRLPTKLPWIMPKPLARPKPTRTTLRCPAWVLVLVMRPVRGLALVLVPAPALAQPTRLLLVRVPALAQPTYLLLVRVPALAQPTHLLLDRALALAQPIRLLLALVPALA